MSSGALRLLAGSAALAGVLAAFQLVLHPLLLDAPLRPWAAYWLYTYLGVILPGTLLTVCTVKARKDWLSWVGVGWAVGHGVELVSLLAAKQLGQPALFALWLLPTYALALGSLRTWGDRVLRLERSGRVAAALGLPLAIGGLTYFALNLAELTAEPPYISDVWFHVSNAIELKHHTPFEDPRLAGEPMKYHLHSYAAPAAASIATGEAVRPLLVRYVGSSCVFLLVLGLFNIGRSLGRGSAIAGAIAALLVVFPIDPAELFGAPALSLRASIRLYGVHLSTTQLMGHVYLAALLLLVSWSFRGLRARDHWPLALLAFAGAGSKAMFGPVIVCGALGVGAWQAVVNRRFDRHAWALAALLAAGVAPAVVPLLIGESSYATTAVLTYSAFAQHTPFFEALVPPLPVAVAASAWVLGFTLWSLVGGVGAIRARAEAGDATRFIVFAWMCFLASLVPTLATELGGHSQLFFLYFGDAALASVAGFGWVTLASRVARPLRSGGRARTLKLGSALAALLLLLLGGRALGLRIPPRLADPETNLIWYRTQWMEAAGMKPYLDASLPDPELEYYWKRLDFTEDHRRALSWMREQWQGDCVFAVNVVSASPYAGHSECRAILETWRFHVLAHQLDQAGLERHFRKRLVALAAWRDDRPNAAELLRSVGVTHVFHDRIAGTPRSALGTVVFDSPGFAIYSLSDPEAAPGAAAR